MTANQDKVRRWWPGKDWIVGTLIVVSLLVSSRAGHSLPIAVQNVAFLILIAAPFVLVAMSLNGLKRASKDEAASSWRVQLSFVGCMALMVALAIPFLVMFLQLVWTRLAIWCLASSLLALLAGVFGE